jgi:hypothetical protein
MATQWHTVREAAEALGVSPDTLVRRMRSGVVAQECAAPLNEDAPVPPAPAMPAPRPQSKSAPSPELPPLPKPPLCTLPPAKPLPPASVLQHPARRTSDAATIAANVAASTSSTPLRDRFDDTFLAAIETELAEIRAGRTTTPVPSFVPAAPAVQAPEASRYTAPVLEMAHPLHAQVQEARKQLKSMWIGIALLLIAVLGGVFWTTSRMDRADQLIGELVQQLDAQQTLVATYKQEIARLCNSLSDSKAQNAKLASQNGRDPQQEKRTGTRLTSTTGK